MEILWLAVHYKRRRFNAAISSADSGQIKFSLLNIYEKFRSVEYEWF